MGLIKAAIPIINKVLKILLPTTLPNNIPALLVSRACIPTNSSGELVPKATIISPIMREEIPRDNAKREAPLTRNSAPIIKVASPIANIINIL